ncbi:MAG TPA: hypothetical protein ENJ87_04335 [Gammaproteobacteria bacterium]|nr:hypothetical protein [Gammaproteobacteria bacterium]
MILTSIILFTLAACLGLFLVVLGLRYHRSSLKVALTHATIAIAALFFLTAQIINGPLNKFNNAAALLMVLALTGGLMLFALRESDKPPAMAVVSIHAIMALAGLLLLALGNL